MALLRRQKTLVEFKVGSAREACALLAGVAGVDEREVADLMKVSEQLPPVLMREYHGPDELMAVFTRPAERSSLSTEDFAFVAEDVAVISRLLAQAVAHKAKGVNGLLYGPPGTGKTALAERKHEVTEVTEVTEMLQGMERQAGLFICTTHLFEELDEAALRRFTVKIQFKPLSADQRSCLATLQQLTPSDFAAVQRQAELLGQTLTPDEFLSQLEGEHRLKPSVRQQRRIGF
jgi:hypothetical protein